MGAFSRLLRDGSPEGGAQSSRQQGSSGEVATAAAAADAAAEVALSTYGCTAGLCLWNSTYHAPSFLAD